MPTGITTSAPAGGKVPPQVAGLDQAKEPSGSAGAGVDRAKLAATAVFCCMVRLQGPVPLQAPPQPVKEYPVEGAATSVRLLPVLKVLVQVAPHELPSEKPTPPAPAIVSVNVFVVGALIAKLADTFFAAFMEMVHVVLVPAQAPPHPAKV